MTIIFKKVAHSNIWGKRSELVHFWNCELGSKFLNNERFNLKWVNWTLNYFMLKMNFLNTSAFFQVSSLTVLSINCQIMSGLIFLKSFECENPVNCLCFQTITVTTLFPQENSWKISTITKWQIYIPNLYVFGTKQALVSKTWSDDVCLPRKTP